MPEGVYAGCVGVSKNILNGIGKLRKVSTTNVRRRDRDVLLNTFEDELHTRVPLLLEKKLPSILPPYMLKVRGS